MKCEFCNREIKTDEWAFKILSKYSGSEYEICEICKDRLNVGVFEVIETFTIVYLR